ncbi:MAG: YoaK family protein [Myxococcales bacterium]
MFRHEGPARDPRLNARIAAYLASNAGFVNSAGIVLTGVFTSHVTGSVGRASTDAAAGDFSAAFSAVLLVLCFFLGAFAASLVVEGSSPSTPVAYGIALLLQSGVLAAFLLAVWAFPNSDPRLLDAQAAILCTAMGMQNSLVTRLSGAVVRTTHLTGIVTDLGIEVARWYRWHRSRIRLPVLFKGRLPPEKPAAHRAALLFTIAFWFSVGAFVGAVCAVRAPGLAMMVPAAATFAAALYALAQARAEHD